MQFEKLVYKDLIIYHCNKTAASQLLHETFDSDQYSFELQSDKPFIIDGGANIGIVTLFFKKRYPKSKIICFEPDPVSFLALQKNMIVNNISNVTLVNVALSDKDNFANFYGQIHFENPDARGNSLIRNWGCKNDTDGIIQVQTTTLSSYLNEEIDFLKLDIEGYEQIVLEEIAHKLHLVKRLSVEVHETTEIKRTNSLKKILKILKKSGYILNVIDRDDRDNLEKLLEAVKDWANRSSPKLYVIDAERISKK